MKCVCVIKLMYNIKKENMFEIFELVDIYEFKEVLKKCVDEIVKYIDDVKDIS